MSDDSDVAPAAGESGVLPVMTPEQRSRLETLMLAQGVLPIENLEDLQAAFWPEEETIEEFLETLYAWRREPERKRL